MVILWGDIVIKQATEQY